MIYRQNVRVHIACPKCESEDVHATSQENWFFCRECHQKFVTRVVVYMALEGGRANLKQP